MATPGKNLNWIDIETTDLDENLPHSKILEVALIVTDPDLNELDRLSLVVREPLPNEELEQWPSAVFKMHSKNGLIEECQHEDTLFSIFDVDVLIAEAIRNNSKGGKLAGNSVGTFDRRWIKKFMPDTFKMLHGYQVHDMRTLITCVESWTDFKVKELYETYNHRAMNDIECSIMLAQYVKDMHFQ